MDWWDNFCDDCKKDDPLEKYEFWSEGQIQWEGCKHRWDEFMALKGPQS